MTQQKENEALMAALEPFAKCCEQIADSEPDDEWAKFRLTIGDYRRAKVALEALARPTQSSGDGEALRIGWWNDMRQRGVSQDVAIQKIMGALASFPAPIPAEREAVGEVVDAEEIVDRIVLTDDDVSFILYNINRKRRDEDELSAHDVREVFGNIQYSGALHRPFRAAPAQPVSEQGEGREGPAPIPNTRLQCLGCKHLHTEDWREPSGDGETYDSGTTALCKAKGGQVIGCYWRRSDDAPKWCPFLPAAPQTDGGKA